MLYKERPRPCHALGINIHPQDEMRVGVFVSELLSFGSALPVRRELLFETRKKLHESKPFVEIRALLRRLVVERVDLIVRFLDGCQNVVDDFICHKREPHSIPRESLERTSSRASVNVRCAVRLPSHT